jgi:hypothetical protein
MLIDLKQNFSKQVFGYFLAAKSDKEKDLQKRILFRKDDTSPRLEKYFKTTPLKPSLGITNPNRMCIGTGLREDLTFVSRS